MKSKTTRANHAPYVTKLWEKRWWKGTSKQDQVKTSSSSNSKETSVVDYTKGKKINTLVILI